MSIELNDIDTSGLLVDGFCNDKAKHSCFAPICPYSYMANKSFLREYIPWLMETGNEILVVVGDYLERHNISFFKDIPIEEAWQRSKIIGDKIIKTIEDIIKERGNFGNIKVSSTSGLIQSHQCRQIISELQLYVDNNRSFREDILNQTKKMLENTARILAKRKKPPQSSLDDICKYMLEEIALYLLLYQRGYQIEIYPGRDMGILQKIVRKEYSDFPYEYKYRTHVSVVVSPNNPIIY